eukprot:12881946-Prorocentrum_lima.AAC.1
MRGQLLVGPLSVAARGGGVGSVATPPGQRARGVRITGPHGRGAAATPTGLTIHFNIQYFTSNVVFACHIHHLSLAVCQHHHNATIAT